MPTKPEAGAFAPYLSEMDFIVTLLIRIGRETAGSLLANSDSLEQSEIEDAIDSLGGFHLFLSLVRTRRTYRWDVFEMRTYLRYVASTLYLQHPELRERMFGFEFLDLAQTATTDVTVFEG
jgi:hypothetical protein